jgi:myo-inositol-1-phosphate synthase
MIVGAEAIRRGRAGTVGLVTETPPLRGLDLVPVGSLAFGGHEIRQGDLPTAAREIARRDRSIPGELVEEMVDALGEASREIRTGTWTGAGESIEKMGDRTDTARPERIREDMESFRERQKCDRLVVINLASTEPAGEPHPGYDDLGALREAMEDPSGGVPPSVVYAHAAMEAGAAYINFTPSVGSSIPALMRLAEDRRVPHMGRDGKTGETLLKSTLAPMFAARGLGVLSWVGYNILGNRDGEVLSNGANALAKVRDKDEALRRILGDREMHSSVRIDYVPSLSDWKTAWDYVHFEGFLGTKMSLQFTWQGCDSMLAAPLALDLVRLADLGLRRGERGLMPHLASFFKSPTGVEEPTFYGQLGLLEAYATQVRA